MSCLAQTVPASALEPLVTERRNPPGDVAMWVFILTKLVTFGLLFMVYGIAWMKHVALFDQMQLTLDRKAGALKQGAVSGWLVLVLAVNMAAYWKGI